MKQLAYLLILSLLVSCSSWSYEWVVSIYWLQWGKTLIEGMGVCVEKKKILTSAHIVNDDRLVYQVTGNVGGWMSVGKVRDRNRITDVAYIELDGICDSQREYTSKEWAQIWDIVSIPVFRSGSILMLTWTIVSLTGNILAYDTIGRTELLTWALIIDREFLPWDSGAPILDGQGRVIDVVHVSAK